MSTTQQPSIGTLVRGWRERRHRSQLEVASESGISARHLSFVETGRSRPSPTLLERVCEELQVPLRERNRLHLAAGFAPPHAERPWADLGAARTAIETLLAGHEPYPAMAVDVAWNVVAANNAAGLLLGAVPERFRQPPLNAVRGMLHPDALAPRIRNYDQWYAHMERRVRRQWDRTALPELETLLAEIRRYPPRPDSVEVATAENDLVVPLVIDSPAGELRLLYSLTVLGAPRDVTLDEIAIETSLPADEATRAVLQDLAQSAASTP